MTPAEIDRVFGRGRLRMATGEHVEVVREAALPGQACRYTKRFVATPAGDFGPWTERERRILERLGAHAGAPVARLVPASAALDTGKRRLQTEDAGPTVDQWASLVPLRRGDIPLANVFEDCAFWWALAGQSLRALDTLHALGFVHLDLKADNVCIPWADQVGRDPAPGRPLMPRFEGLALIDVAFSVLPDVAFAHPLPLALQPDYEYQSPRLLEFCEHGRHDDPAALQHLDWRCDFFSLAAMLWHYLPEAEHDSGRGWTAPRHAHATALVRLLLSIHGAALPTRRPHAALIELTTQRLREPGLAAALQAVCTFDPDRVIRSGAEPTPPTRIVFRAIAEPEEPKVADPPMEDAVAAPASAPDVMPLVAEPAAAAA
ncbi:MAG: hypothetical protein M3Z29_14265, partial [Pseudomonadota bacterium]|nr:hypothetical protein [Pseudomonadota bacterium]